MSHINHTVGVNWIVYNIIPNKITSYHVVFVVIEKKG